MANSIVLLAVRSASSLLRHSDSYVPDNNLLNAVNRP
jgi:hypothetical protein